MKLYFVLIAIFLLIGIASGATIPYQASDTAIIWNYSTYENVINASIDGVLIKDFNPYVGVYALSNLQKNETHIFTIYNGEYFSQEVTTQNPKTEQEKTFEYINVYLYFIIALIALIISVWERLAGFVAILFSTLGLLQSIDNSFFNAILFVTVLLISIASVGYER